MKLETKIIKGMRNRYKVMNGGIETIFSNKKNKDDYERFLTALLEWNLKDSDVFKPKEKEK